MFVCLVLCLFVTFMPHNMLLDEHALSTIHVCGKMLSVNKVQKMWWGKVGTANLLDPSRDLANSLSNIDLHWVLLSCFPDRISFGSQVLFSGLTQRPKVWAGCVLRLCRGGLWGAWTSPKLKRSSIAPLPLKIVFLASGTPLDSSRCQPSGRRNDPPFRHPAG